MNNDNFLKRISYAKLCLLDLLTRIQNYSSAMGAISAGRSLRVYLSTHLCELDVRTGVSVIPTYVTKCKAG